MNRTFLSLIACVTALPAQQIGGGIQPAGQSQQGVLSFQPAETLAVGRAGRGTAITIPRAETGKPFSATVTSQTVQTYIDGTHISRTSTMVEYRDAAGRVRTETPVANSVPNILIRDNVAGVNYRLDPTQRSAVRMPIAAMVAQAVTIPRPASAEPASRLVQLQGEAGDGIRIRVARIGAHINPNEIVEDLGITSVNGVQARGTRSTTIVPAGTIGNDREFRSIEERWFSTDLNLLIKSESTDPRFGKTTYELTNISRQPPDPALFQVPPDYTVSENGRGRK